MNFLERLEAIVYINTEIKDAGYVCIGDHKWVHKDNTKLIITVSDILRKIYGTTDFKKIVSMVINNKTRDDNSNIDCINVLDDSTPQWFNELYSSKKLGVLSRHELLMFIKEHIISMQAHIDSNHAAINKLTRENMMLLINKQAVTTNNFLQDVNSMPDYSHLEDYH